MGYSTYFNGEIAIDKAVDDETKRILDGLNQTRRMKRNVDESIYGKDGEFYFGSGDFGQDEEENIVDYNCPPSTQPSLWCEWALSEDRQHFHLNDGKVYEYIEWLKYLRERVLIPRGYSLSEGEISWDGDDQDDFGIISVKDNQIYVSHGKRTYSTPELA